MSRLILYDDVFGNLVTMGTLKACSVLELGQLDGVDTAVFHVEVLRVIGVEAELIALSCSHLKVRIIV